MQIFFKPLSKKKALDFKCLPLWRSPAFILRLPSISAEERTVFKHLLAETSWCILKEVLGSFSEPVTWLFFITFDSWEEAKLLSQAKSLRNGTKVHQELSEHTAKSGISMAAEMFLWWKRLRCLFTRRAQVNSIILFANMTPLSSLLHFKNAHK